MTEQTVPFGGTAVAEPPAPVLPPDTDDSGAPDNRRKLMAVAGGAGLLVLVIAAFFLLKGGGSTTNDSGTVPSAHHVAPSSAPANTAAKPITLPKQFKGTVGRDPFKALYVAPASGGASTSSTSSTSTSTSTSTAPTTSTSTSTTTSTTTATATYHPVWLELRSTYGTKWANFTVGYSNGKTLKTIAYNHVMAPTNADRTVFANVFALLGITKGDASVQFGDGTPVDIAPGAGSRLVVG